MKLVLSFVAIVFAALQAQSQLWLPDVFGDNMVLQRDRPVHFWGKAFPGDTVTVRFSGEIQSMVARPDSTWSVFFKKQKGNPIPQTITMQSGDRIVVLKNVLIGDLWICSGQSNMEFPFAKEAHAGQEYASAFQPLIRLCNPPPAGRYVYGVPYTDSLLRRLDSGHFYLWNGWNVCDINTVKPMSAVAYYFAKKIVDRTNIPIGIINLSIGGAPIETFISCSAMRADPLFAAKVKTGNWLDNGAIPAWVRERGRQNTGTGYEYGDDRGPNHAYKPGFAFMCGMEPLLPMPIKGIIGYGGMVVCTDIGAKKDVHPTNKKEVGERLARWALKQDYHFSVTPSGPLPLSARYEHGKVVIRFRYAQTLKTSGGGPLRGFSLDGPSEVNAVIYGHTVQIPVDRKPLFVCYGWQPFTDANLVNDVFLPASTFKIEVQ